MARSTEIRMRRRTRLVLNETEHSSSKRILEIGCGTGEMSYWMAQNTVAQVVGSDICAPFVQLANEKFHLPNLSYTVLDFNKANEWPDKNFNYIVGNGILHHLYNNLDESLASMRGLLTVGGKLVFIEPNIYNPYIYAIFSSQLLRKWANLEPEEMAFSKTFITQKLAQAGYTDIQVDYKDFLLPGIPTYLVNPSIALGRVLEKAPVLKKLSQSIFIRAVKTYALFLLVHFTTTAATSVI